MQKCMKLILFLILILPICLLSQYTNFIPADRRVDWTHVGLINGINRNVDLEINFQTLKGLNPGVGDDGVFTIARTQANTFKASHPGAWVSIYFPTGTYTFFNYVQLTPADGNLIIRGDGRSTLLDFKYDADARTVLGLFSLNGQCSETPTFLSPSANLSKGSRFLQTSSGPTPAIGDIIVLSQDNFPGLLIYDQNNTGHRDEASDIVGQISKIKSNENPIELEDELRLTYYSNFNPRFKVMTPIQNIGFENFKLLSSSNVDGGAANFFFGYAASCWIWGVESDNASQAHVLLSNSTNIEVRGCYFHHAKSYGAGGRGYGVSIGNHSSRCLIEDNVFSYLRHAMITYGGANGNVWGYNFSNDEYHTSQIPDWYDEGDISIHGGYPFANLFEGNYAQYVVADDWWGPNGPYNTFFRNYIYKNDIVLERTGYTNVVGCEFIRAGLGVDYSGERESSDYNRNMGSANVLDIYGLYLQNLRDVSSGTNITHVFDTENEGAVEDNVVMNDISLYRSSKPSFLAGYSFPPIGPFYNYNPTDGSRYRTTQVIPAVDRYIGQIFTSSALPLIKPPLTVGSILGPTTVSSNEEYSFAVTPNGGSTPYNYQWWIQNSGSVTEYSAMAPNKSDLIDGNIAPNQSAPPPTWQTIGLNSPILSTVQSHDFALKCDVRDNNGITITSNIFNVVVNGATPSAPSAPINVTLQSSSGTYGFIKVSWINEDGIPVDCYEVNRLVMSYPGVWEVVATTSNTYWVDQEYIYAAGGGDFNASYKIRAIKNGLYSDYSGTASVRAEMNGKMSFSNSNQEAQLAVEIPDKFALRQNYPNPFNPSTTISFDLPKDSPVSLKIYDMIGHEIATLVDGYRPAGRYNFSFDASRLSSGMYIYKIQTAEFSAIKKMQLLK